MSRFRANRAPSANDREISLRLDRAAQEVAAALGIARGQSRTAGYIGMRARGVERELGRLLQAIESVGSITPRYGYTDPDLVSEEERNRSARETRRKEVNGG